MPFFSSILHLSRLVGTLSAEYSYSGKWSYLLYIQKLHHQFQTTALSPIFSQPGAASGSCWFTDRGDNTARVLLSQVCALSSTLLWFCSPLPSSLWPGAHRAHHIAPSCAVMLGELEKCLPPLAHAWHVAQLHRWLITAIRDAPSNVPGICTTDGGHNQLGREGTDPLAVPRQFLFSFVHCNGLQNAARCWMEAAWGLRKSKGKEGISEIGYCKAAQVIPKSKWVKY